MGWANRVYEIERAISDNVISSSMMAKEIPLFFSQISIFLDNKTIFREKNSPYLDVKHIPKIRILDL